MWAPERASGGRGLTTPRPGTDVKSTLGPERHRGSPGSVAESEVPVRRPGWEWVARTKGERVQGRG